MPIESRREEIDGLRGLMLILMTLTHLPTAFSGPLGQPLGFVSAAEGFVFLSAFLVGSIYTGVARKRGLDAMRAALLSRAAKVYAAHIGLLIAVLVVLARYGEATGNVELTNWLSFHARNPGLATASAFVLVYDPPLFDILPMYVVFLALTPAVLRHAFARGWARWLAGSAVLWLLAQFSVPRAVYEFFASALSFPVPYQATGAFSWIGWQFLWLLGLWVGYRMSGRARPLFFPRPLLAFAIAIVLTGFVWRHLVGQAPFGGQEALNLWFDKWHLGPLRMLNFAALTIVAIQFGGRLKPLARVRILTVLGHSALPVFCAHLVVCALALAFWKRPEGHPVSADLGLLVAAFAVLYAVAMASEKLLGSAGPATVSSVSGPAAR